MKEQEEIFSLVVRIPIGGWFDAKNKTQSYTQKAILYSVDDKYDPTKGIEILAMKDLPDGELYPEEMISKIVNENHNLIWEQIKDDVMDRCSEYIEERHEVERKNAQSF